MRSQYIVKIMQCVEQSYNPAPLNEAVKEQGFTNEKLAVKACLSARTVSSIRNGDENVKLSTLKKAASALNLKVVIRFEPQGVADTAGP